MTGVWLAILSIASAQDVCEGQTVVDRNCNLIDATDEGAVDLDEPSCALAVEEDARAALVDSWFDYDTFGCTHSVLALDTDEDGQGWGLIVLRDDDGRPYQEVRLQCDTCPDTPDDQLDTDCDGIGDACDVCPDDANPSEDIDGDGVGDACDACPTNPNTDPTDTDDDGVPDVCDVCPRVADDGSDIDGDGVGDACDVCPDSPLPARDDDGDGVADSCGPPLRLNGGAACNTAPLTPWLVLLVLPVLRRRPSAYAAGPKRTQA